MCVTGYAEWVEPIGTGIAIFIVNFMNAWLGTSNDKAYAKLKAQTKKDTVLVIRDGKVVEIDFDEIVVGDIIKLQSGDKIQADGCLVHGKLKVDNSALNGETEECKKIAIAESEYGNIDFFEVNVNPDGTNSFADGKGPKITGDTFVDNHSLFKGVTILDGEGLMVVQSVGMCTMMGKMAEDMNSGEEIETPLKKKLHDLANRISVIGYVAGGLIAVTSFMGYVFDIGGFGAFMALEVPMMLKYVLDAVSTAVTVVVCAVPEGLPMTISLVLMQNTGRLMRHNVLVRKSNGIETAGSLNVLCSDKTGTITKNLLEVVDFVDGTGKTSPASDIPSSLRDLIYMVISNNTAASFDDKHVVVGSNSTDRCLLKFVGEEAFKKYSSGDNIEVVDIQEFNSSNKFSQSAVKIDGEYKVFYKGAPEKLLSHAKKCVDGNGKVVDLNLDAVNEQMRTLQDKAMRVLAIGYSTSKMVESQINSDVVLLGLVGIRDDVRPEAAAAIKEVQDAGIQVIMITGDNINTAKAISREAGLLKSEDDLAITSADMAEMSDEDIIKILPRIRVIARALPTDKSRLVRIAQSQNLVVGMTGDGVNDSPALKAADVGFAMGSGSSVAKEAGDLVITDDNFKSIRDAIWLGRAIYHNIQKFCKMQLTINFVATFICMVFPLLGIEQPLKVTHLLFINLIMDSLASIMMANEPALEIYMNEKPRRRDESIITKAMGAQIGWQAVYISVMSFAFFFIPLFKNLFSDTTAMYSAYFVMFIMAVMVNALNIRSDGPNVFSHLNENKIYMKIWALIIAITVFITIIGGPISSMFSLTNFGITAWAVIVLMALTVYPVDLVRKAFTKVS